jgi:hypothetical protein
MKTRRKSFDCVEMKDRIQARILAEYEARKDRAVSFDEFVRAKANASPWVRRMKRRVRSSGNVVDSRQKVAS